MLQLNRENFGQFSEADLRQVLEEGGWEAILPNSLTDSQLVCVSDQLRGILWGEGTRGPDGEPNASIAMALLLMAKAHPLAGADSVVRAEGSMEQLRDVLMVLSVAADREIVNRILNRPNDQEAQSILSGIEEIMVSPETRAPFTSRKTRRHPQGAASRGQTSRISAPSR